MNLCKNYSPSTRRCAFRSVWQSRKDYAAGKIVECVGKECPNWGEKDKMSYNRDEISEEQAKQWAAYMQKKPHAWVIGNVNELNLYKAALTKAVSLPKGQLPHEKGRYFTTMICGQVVVTEDK